MAQRWRRFLSICLALPFVLAACSSGEQAERPILFIGDSIFAWNAPEDQSIPDVLAEELGREVRNNAVPGGQFLNAPVGLDIRDQFYLVRRMRWEWVVMMGGGNDLNAECGCGECSEIQDALLGPNGDSGRIFEFVNLAARNGRKVMFVGYYEVPTDAWFGFNECGDELIEYSRRLALMAEQSDNVWFVDAREAVTADDVSAYDEDRVHPSPEGSELVGRLVAEALTEAAAEAAVG